MEHMTLVELKGYKVLGFIARNWDEEAIYVCAMANLESMLNTFKGLVL